MSEEIKNIQEELNEQMQIRRDKLAEYEADGIYPFGQRFVVKDYAKDIKEAIVHELTHKQHWDSAKAFYKANKKRYNSLEEAMTYLNRDLVTYVKKQHSIDTMYLYRISINALSAFETNNINELVAEVGVLGNNTPDDTLLQKVQEAVRLRWAVDRFYLHGETNKGNLLRVGV